MSRFKTIQYAIDTETGFIVSRIDSEVAYPVLDYESMQPSNNFTPSYRLMRMDVLSIAGAAYNRLKWTRKVPLAAKQEHRKFWGMKPLKRDPLPYEFMIVDAVAI